MNLYGYADADPINNSDPFGLTPCHALPLFCAELVGGGFVVGGGTAAGAGALGGIVAGATAGAAVGTSAILGYLLVSPAFPGDGELLSRSATGTFAAEATAVYSKNAEDDEFSGGHRKGAKESTRERHEEGERRRRQDQAREKGDKRRTPNPNKHGNPKKPDPEP